jgi:hypothetical protein
MAILAHEGAHKKFGFSTLGIWLKGVIIAFLVGKMPKSSQDYLP